MTDEKMLDKLGKLKAHMESAQEIGNEAEAQAFATMLQNLLAKYKLEMTDLQYSSHLQDEPVEEYEVGGGVDYSGKELVYKKFPEVKVRKRRIGWIETLASVIARAHSCQILCSFGSSRIWMVGRKTDAQVAEYLFVTMLRSAEKISWKEYCDYYYRVQDEGDVTRARGFRASFLDGFVTRLAQRFEEEKRKMEQNNSGTALMRINKEALAVKEYMENKKGKKAKACQQKGFHRDGYERGKAVANGLNLKANACKEGQANKQLN